MEDFVYIISTLTLQNWVSRVSRIPGEFFETERYINIYNRYIDMGRLGSFEIGKRLEIFIFRGVGWGDRVGPSG